jgi:hypothetical protein
MNTQNYPLVTEEERKAYGDDLLSVVERKALEALRPIAGRLQNENADLRRRLAAQDARSIYEVLDAEIPNWKEVNVHPDFLQWLSAPDVYSGAAKAALIRQAFAAADAQRVLAMFTGFLREHPEHRSGSGSQSRSSSVRSGSRSFASEAPVTPKDIDTFYRRVREGYYNGRDEQRIKDETALHRAAHLNGVNRYAK